MFSTGSVQKLVEEEGMSLSINKTRAHFCFSSCSTTLKIITCLWRERGREDSGSIEWSEGQTHYSLCPPGISHAVYNKNSQPWKPHPLKWIHAHILYLVSYINSGKRFQALWWDYLKRQEGERYFKQRHLGGLGPEENKTPPPLMLSLQC